MVSPIKGWQHPRRRGVSPVVWSYRALLHCWDQQRLMLPPPLAGSEQRSFTSTSPCSPARLVSLGSETCSWKPSPVRGHSPNSTLCPPCRSPQLVESPLGPFCPLYQEAAHLTSLLPLSAREVALHQPAIKGVGFTCLFWVR